MACSLLCLFLGDQCKAIIMVHSMTLWVFMMAVLYEGLPHVSCMHAWQPSLPFDATSHVSLAKAVATEPLCQETQRAALLEFASSGFNSTSTEGESAFFGDPTPNCCNWPAVTCDNSGFVISLSLYLPPYYIEDHERHFNASPLAKLQSLEALELGNIDFDSSAIALFSSTLTSLRIEDSPLRSPIPWAALTAKLFRLTTLEVSNLPAQLDGNMLTPELCNLTRLETLTIKSVGLRGSIPSCLSKLPRLVSLDLSDNHLQGLIPQHWNATSPLEWLDLSSNFLMGFIYPSLLGRNRVHLDVSTNNLTGSIPQYSLGNSTNLNKLSMANNQLSGEIPDQWGNLLNLKELDLSGNHLMGEIPASMGQLGLNTSLVYQGTQNEIHVSIDLSSNWLAGDLPWSLLFTNAPLEVLNLGFNNLTSRLHAQNGRELKHQSNFSSLRTLDLSHNSLIGPMPSWIASLHSLEKLNLSYNMLVSPSAHDAFSNVSTAMKTLDLSFNYLTGPIPSWLSLLASLETLYMSSNQLQGTIPPWFWSLPQLWDINLSRNQLSGDIRLRQWLCDGAVQSDGYSFLGFKNNFSRVVMDGGWDPNCFTGTAFRLDLHSNDLSGEIPWVDLLSFDYDSDYWNFADNRLTGELPDQEKLSGLEMHFLETLDLSHNFMSGRIPGWLGSVGMSSLQLSFNNFTGEIPSGLCDYLEGGGRMISLKLDHNSLSGTLPDEFDNDGCKHLVSLVLSDNHLTGPIPPSLRNLSSSLVVLDLSHNHLEGLLPVWIQQMHSLRVLSLSFNGLSGSLPSTIWNCTKLQVLDLSNNNLSGSISAQSFSQLQGFAYSSIRETLVNSSLTLYDESLTIRGKGLDLQFTYLLTATVSLDLSNNALHGPIPPQLGALDGLIFLDLSNNRLTGHIPEGLSRLTELNSLELSANELEGEIPEALCSLTFLSYVNVSRNNLRGPIPECKQWGTFSSDSFVGNQGLCGPPLAVLCPSNTSTQVEQGGSSDVPEEEGEEEEEDHDFLLANLVGFCVGFPLFLATTIFWWPANRRILKASQWIIAKLVSSGA